MFEFDSKDSRRLEKSCEGLSLLKGKNGGIRENMRHVMLR